MDAGALTSEKLTESYLARIAAYEQALDAAVYPHHLRPTLARAYE